MLPLQILTIINVIKNGYNSSVFIPILIYLLLVVIIYSRRVTLGPEGIRITTYYVLKKFIHFDDIVRSDLQILVERDHPVRLIIQYRETDRDNVVEINLKSILKEDVDYLCSMKRLKISS